MDFECVRGTKIACTVRVVNLNPGGRAFGEKDLEGFWGGFHFLSKLRFSVNIFYVPSHQVAERSHLYRAHSHILKADKIMNPTITIETSK